MKSRSVHAPSLSDEEVIARVTTGDTPLFEILMRRYNQRVYRAVRSILGSDDSVEDVMQEGYLRAFAALGTYSGSGAFGAWLTRIAVNEAIRARKERSRWFDQDPTSDWSGDGAGLIAHESPEKDVSLRSLLADAIDELPDGQRAVFVLRQVEQLSVQETADSLDISTANVKTSYHRARRRLREAVEKRLGGELNDVFAFDGARCDRIVGSVLSRIVDARRD